MRFVFVWLECVLVSDTSLIGSCFTTPLSLITPPFLCVCVCVFSLGEVLFRWPALLSQFARDRGKKKRNSHGAMAGYKWL